MDEIYTTGKLSEDCSKIELNHPQVMRKILNHLIGNNIELRIKKLEYSRSDAQNRWYWGVAITRIRAWYKECNGITYTPDEIHAFNIINIIGQKPVISEVMGKEVIVLRQKTTSKMTTKEFNDFKEQLQNHYSLLGCDIPDPREDCFIINYV